MEPGKELADNIEIFPDIFEYFARCMIPLVSEVGYIARKSDHPRHSRLLEQLAVIDSCVADFALEDRRFVDYHLEDDPDSVDRESRIWALEQALQWEIPTQRIASLEPHDGSLPAPLDHPALANLSYQSDYLVSLRDFEWDFGRLVRNEYAFLPFSPVESPNSQVWFFQELMKLRVDVQSYVRLDPFLHGSLDDFHAVGYKMLVYGLPLDWDRIKNLREEEHGQWLPGSMTWGIRVTDYAWTPRGSEVHFRCEEIPVEDRLCTRGSRYFHAVYVPSRNEVVHLDASVRIYSESEMRERLEFRHVRKAGKIGRRYKVFRIDEPVPVEVFSNLCTQFFVWNYDVQRYFGASIPIDF